MAHLNATHGGAGYGGGFSIPTGDLDPDFALALQLQREEEEAVAQEQRQQQQYQPPRPQQQIHAHQSQQQARFSTVPHANTPFAYAYPMPGGSGGAFGDSPQAHQGEAHYTGFGDAYPYSLSGSEPGAGAAPARRGAPASARSEGNPRGGTPNNTSGGGFNCILQ